MTNPCDVAWAAGFLEGEGNFSPGSTGISITARQVVVDPLIRLQNLFGGSLKQRKNGSPLAKQLIYVWMLCGKKAADLCSAIYPQMSGKRQTAIDAMLEKFNNQPGRGYFKNSPICKRGHSEWGINPTTGWRFCEICAEASRERYLA